MIIGIDIDNTLTEVQEELNKAAYDYAIKLGKNIENPENSLEDIKNNGDLYRKTFQFTYEELKYFLKDIQEEITNNAKPREGAVETIKKLRKDGHKIYIVTARDSEFHDDPYNQSKNWLDKNNIEYDKLIVNAREKAPVCEKEKIDLFIDDQLNNCIDVFKIGISTIKIGDNNVNIKGIINYNNWNDIYNYINNETIFKIVSYDKSNDYNFDIHNFVNQSMYEFIGRPYKNREDVLNIYDYYLKNNGNFWIAYDVNNYEILGTIALENRKDYAILKRFYVKDNYQNCGIGQMLYNTLEKYILNETNINKIYLACGIVLTKAHKFYNKNGFKQIEKLDIEMHFADDDDFFVKNIERSNR